MEPSPVVGPRLRLPLLDHELLEDCIAGRTERAARRLDIAALAPEFLADTEYLVRRWQDLRNLADYAPFGPRALLHGDPAVMVGDVSCHGVPDDPPLQARLALLDRDAVAQPITTRCCEIGYRVYPAWRERGYAREAVAAVAEWLARVHAVRRLVASIAPDNVPSRQVALGLGFERVGEWLDPIDGVEDVWVWRLQ